MGEQESRLEIDKYRAEDLGVLQALDAICFPEDIAFSRAELLSHINHRHSITRIARLKDAIVGFIIGKIESKDAVHILTLDVDPRMRRHRVGTALMDVMHDESLRQGVKVSVLEVDVQNDAARRFYEQLHYGYSGILPGYYNGHRDAYQMIRILRPCSDR